MTIESPEPNPRPVFHSAFAVQAFLADVSIAGSTRVVRVTGELDLAARDQLVSVSTTGHHPAIVIDLGGVAFLDCSGYGALVTSRNIIEGEGRSVTITGQTGQPARLFDLIAELENERREGSTPVAVGCPD
jgi:anti-anti-sigma factor